MKKARLCRQYFPRYTQSTLVVVAEDGTEFKCVALELPWLDNKPSVSCIPEGVYTVVRRHSKKYGWHLHITGVDGRQWILIHWGNFAASANPNSGKPDIEGCVLVGYGYADFDKDGYPEITKSRDAFNDLMEFAPDGFELTIEQ